MRYSAYTASKRAQRSRAILTHVTILRAKAELTLHLLARFMFRFDFRGLSHWRLFEGGGRWLVAISVVERYRNAAIILVP